jgi:hypothetical protein
MDKIKVNLHIDDIYFTYWQGVRSKHRTNQEAYEEVEQVCVEQYGVNIFETYDAFRTALCRYNAKYGPAIKKGESSVLTNVGYFKRYYEIKTDGMTQPEAYLRLEGEIRSEYGVNVYTTFHAFERSLQRYIKNIKNINEKSLLKLQKA